MKVRNISPAEVDYWLNVDQYTNYFDENATISTGDLVFNVDMIRLCSIRKAISNFVRILTRKNIPVYFNDKKENLTNNNIIHISSKIHNKQDFDVAVGLALHEAAHCIKTDTDVVKVAWSNVPSTIWKKSDSKNIRRNIMEKYIHDIWNCIEDRYIDDYVFNTAPGYRGYYVALYNRYWHNSIIDEYIKSDYCRYPSLKSYDFRILGLINENTDLTALPRLDEIADVIDIQNINRLTTTKSRINVAFKVIEIILECIDKSNDSIQKSKLNVRKTNELADPRDYFDFGDDSSEETSDKKSSLDVEQKMIGEISDIINDRETPKDNSDFVDKISEEQVPSEIETDINKAMDEQRRFLRGDIFKESISPAQKSLLDSIERHGIVLVSVNVPNILPGDSRNFKVDCIVVQKMTKELILLGDEIFPFSSVMKLGETIPEPPIDTYNAVTKGINLGTKLGRKLQIRSETNPYKIVRKKSGKINKRYLHAAAYDADDLFYKIQVEKNKDANIHITVDASSSMNGDKWLKTMIAVVAICKAASMVNNIHVTVSFRATYNSGLFELPYIVLAYDSRVDRFSKIKTLFPYLKPYGYTPEGLAFGAIMNLFENITPDEEDRYFLNLSDGEPCYVFTSNNVTISYSKDIGVTHTKNQIDKIRQCGVKILSYFIQHSHKGLDQHNNMCLSKSISNSSNPLQRDFQKMYGQSAEFIDVENIIDLAKTVNGLFLSSMHEQKS